MEAPYSSTMKLLTWNTSNGNFQGSCDVINRHAIHVRNKTQEICEMQIWESKTIYFHSEKRLMVLMIYYKDDELFKV
jgi:hypothetical protein